MYTPEWNTASGVRADCYEAGHETPVGCRSVVRENGLSMVLSASWTIAVANRARDAAFAWLRCAATQ